MYGSGEQVLKKSKTHLQTFGRHNSNTKKFNTQNPQILGATVQHLVAAAKWGPGFVHPRCKGSGAQQPEREAYYSLE
jgi:hypothetical protein